MISLLRARAYRGKAHDVLTVDTEGLVESHEDEIILSPINSGAIFGSGRRGAQTFRSIDDYPYQEVLKRKKKDAVVELAVNYAVKDISELTAQVEEWRENTPLKVIWQKDS